MVYGNRILGMLLTPIGYLFSIYYIMFVSSCPYWFTLYYTWHYLYYNYSSKFFNIPQLHSQCRGHPFPLPPLCTAGRQSVAPRRAETPTPWAAPPTPTTWVWRNCFYLRGKSLERGRRRKPCHTWWITECYWWTKGGVIIYP